MNDEFIMFNDEDESYQESYESDENVTLGDVEAYLESLSTDIDEATMLRDDMVQEGYEYEDLTLEDVETFIESATDKYNNIVDTVNGIVQEAAEATDDSGVDDFEEGVINKIKAKNDIKKSGELEGVIAKVNNTMSIDDFSDWGDKVAAERRAAGLPEEDIGPITYKRIKLGGKKNKDKSVKETYALDNPFAREAELDTDEPLTAYEFFDESYEPDDDPLVYASEQEHVYTQEMTLLQLIGIGAGVIVGIKACKAIIGQLLTSKKYGRFPKDMKRLFDIIETENFEASENKRVLKKALRKINKDLEYMLHGFGSRWKVTVDEANELRKLKQHVNDLYTRGFMLSSNKSVSDKRRVGERIEGLVKQSKVVLEMLNKSVYKNTTPDVTTEYMV